MVVSHISYTKRRLSQQNNKILYLFQAGMPASQAVTADFPAPPSPNKNNLYSMHSKFSFKDKNHKKTNRSTKDIGTYIIIFFLILRKKFYA